LTWDPLLQVAIIIVLGVAAQWLAARLRLPSILLLLLFGFLGGPVTGVLTLPADPGHAEVLFPIISIAVALILYEGGLTLKLAEIRRTGRVVRALCSVGALVTWVISLLAAHWIFALDLRVATLLGAILVVTGPTVIGPLLSEIRPSGPVGPILKWEGIIIDPIGALLAVLVFEVLPLTEPARAFVHVLRQLGLTLLVGGGLGVATAYALAFVLRRYWVPDFLQSAVSLMLVVAIFAIANTAQHESGLLAVTVMGIVLANQRLADLRHIVEFKENLRVLLLAGLFIVLAARLQPADLRHVLVPGSAFVLVLVLLARPLSVLAATAGAGLAFRERAFLMCVAPRGIVAAAVASVFAERLAAAGVAQARLLVPIIFLVIIGTVLIYGLGAPLVAHQLGVAARNPQGLLIIGAQAWTRALARVLRARGVPVLLVDNNRHKVAAARDEGLPTYAGSILAEYAPSEIDLGGLGRLLAVTPNDWVNALAVQRFTRVFGAAECYQLPPREEDSAGEHRHLHGRWLFGRECTYAELARRFGENGRIAELRVAAGQTWDELVQAHGARLVPLCVLKGGGRLAIVAADKVLELEAGQAVIALMPQELVQPEESLEQRA
jgi:NhaP-type Na+/H+ or K+/H+ antiporter